MPEVGSRVVVRYRLPAGSIPPLTDVVGHLVETGTTLRVRTKRGAVVDVDAADVVAIKALSAAPVRTADIRNLEHAAALAWPGVEQEWLGGWLLRFGHGSTRRANSAVPLDVTIDLNTNQIVDWYESRGVASLIAAPDRLFRVPPGVPTEAENLVMTSDVTTPAASDVVIASLPDHEWLRTYRREVPVDVLTAVVDGQVAFATVAGAAVGRAAVTDAPDGTRWVGLSAVHAAEAARGRGVARALCAALLGWGAEKAASRAYVQVLADNSAAIRLFETMGFGVHHHSRYVDARSL
ncbi:MAG TPA: GNAT family N-acetyltransferase [Mycobacterium sp.]|nr:GNAT family N-acetyltransferase [Mycobacterium sp.]